MNKLIRNFIVALLIILSYVLQIIFLPRIPHLLTIPNFFLITTASCGFLYGRTVGLVTGFLSGLILDVLGGGTPGFFILIYSLLGFGNGFLGEKMESEILLMVLLLCITNEILFHTYSFFFSFIIGKSFNLLSYIRKVAIPETLFTLILFFPLYGLLLFISRKAEIKLTKGAIRIV